MRVSVVEKTALNDASIVVKTMPRIKNASKISIKVKPRAPVIDDWISDTVCRVMDIRCSILDKR